MDAYGNEDSGEADGSSVEEFKEKPVRLRTRITISLMSSILTLSYVVSGAFRVFGKCFSPEVIFYFYKHTHISHKSLSIYVAFNM